MAVSAVRHCCTLHEQMLQVMWLSNGSLLSPSVVFISLQTTVCLVYHTSMTQGMVPPLVSHKMKASTPAAAAARAHSSA